MQIVQADIRCVRSPVTTPLSARGFSHYNLSLAAFALWDKALIWPQSTIWFHTARQGHHHGKEKERKVKEKRKECKVKEERGVKKEYTATKAK